MSANFLCGVLAMQKGQEPDWAAAETILRKLTSDEIKNLAQNYASEFGFDEEDFDDASVVFDENKIRDTLNKVFTEIHNAWIGEELFYSRFDLQNLTLLVTGDRTYGDPVEEINYMVLFGESGMAKAAGFQE